MASTTAAPDKYSPTDHLTGDPVRDTAFARWLTLSALKLFPRHKSKKRWLGRLCTLPFGIIVKSGPNHSLHLSEANAMQFIAKNTTVPVPKVYCAFVEDGKTYIVMRKIKGDWIGCGWRSRPEKSKSDILASLKAMLDQIRALQPPPGIGVQNLVGGPLADCRIKDEPNDLFGPFRTVADLHRWQRFDFDGDVSHITGPLSINAQAALKVVEIHRKNDAIPLKFTHGDLNDSNILVRGDRVVGIIDWATAGWYPAYWEYAMTITVGVGDTCKPEVATRYLDEYDWETRALGEVFARWQR